MLKGAKILCLSTAMLGAITPAYALAKSKKRTSAKAKQSIAIGFKGGSNLFLKPSVNLLKNYTRPNYALSNKVFLRKSINARLNVETGLNYNIIKNASVGINNQDSRYKFNPRSNQLEIPVTIQYYFVPSECKLKPFCGAGIQFDADLTKLQPQGNYGKSSVDNTPMSGTNYVSIIFTQGMTYEVNTKIQVTQSFHFIPGNTDKTIGFDLGVGYKFP